MSSSYVYVLTDVTRKASEQRRVVISGFDVRWRTVAIAMIGFLPGVMVTALLWPIFSQNALVALPLTIMVIYFMIEHRSKTGLHLPMWKQIADKKKSTVGKYFICNVEIDPEAERMFMIRRSSVPVIQPDKLQLGDDGFDRSDPLATIA